MHWSKLQVYLDSTRGQNYLAMLYDHKAGSECVGKKFDYICKRNLKFGEMTEFCFKFRSLVFLQINVYLLSRLLSKLI